MPILGLNGLNLGSALFFLGNIKIYSFSYFPPAIPEINSLSIISVIFVQTYSSLFSSVSRPHSRYPPSLHALKD